VSISLRGLDPRVRERAELALAWAKYYGLTVTVTSGYRSWAEQTKLRAAYEKCLARGETISPANPNPECRYPANRPGDSAHNVGFAWDSHVPAHQQWTWNYLRRYAGFDVPTNDEIHAEVPQWRQHITPNLRRG
jgi:LAS superfamily LD-carboxypeptidase LdcB